MSRMINVSQRCASRVWVVAHLWSFFCVCDGKLGQISASMKPAVRSLPATACPDSPFQCAGLFMDPTTSACARQKSSQGK